MKYLKILLFIFLIIPNISFADCRGAFSDVGGDTVCIDDPLQGAGSDPNILIGKVINATLGIVGSLALVMFIYGGFTWMLAAGNDQRVQKGKDILVWATVGLIVIFASYAMVRFVFTGLGVT